MTAASECQNRSLPNEKGQTSSRRRRVLAHQPMESSAPGSTGGQGRPHPPLLQAQHCPATGQGKVTALRSGMLAPEFRLSAKCHRSWTCCL